MSLRTVLRDVVKEVADEAERNPEFAQRLEKILFGRVLETSARNPSVSQRSEQDENRRRGNRRAPAILDPIALAEKGEDVLRTQLESLDLDQLRDVVADYGMDPGKLVMKWKTPERVIDKIVEVSMARSRKGDAFRP